MSSHFLKKNFLSNKKRGFESNFPLEINHELGTLFKINNFTFFFGKKNSEIQALRLAFPSLAFTRIQQTHSDLITQSSVLDDLTHQADAHYSFENNHALCISTADCIPVLIACPSLNYISAIHAGWRGVANQICLKSLKKIQELSHINGIQGENINEPIKIFIFIGPHILKSSFEIELETLNLLLAKNIFTEKIDPEVASSLFEEKNNKYFVDLSLLLKFQISSVFATALGSNPGGVFFDIEFFELPIDTKTSIDYHSWRRDSFAAKRQISFIFKNNF